MVFLGPSSWAVLDPFGNYEEKKEETEVEQGAMRREMEQEDDGDGGPHRAAQHSFPPPISASPSRESCPGRSSMVPMGNFASHPPHALAHLSHGWCPTGRVTYGPRDRVRIRSAPPPIPAHTSRRDHHPQPQRRGSHSVPPPISASPSCESCPRKSFTDGTTERASPMAPLSAC